MPTQEPGLRRARALPYVLNAIGHADLSAKVFTIDFSNSGDVGVFFQVRSGSSTDAPRSYTVGAGASLSDSWNLNGSYSLSVHGPNGFLRKFVGTASSKADFVVKSSYNARSNDVIVAIANKGATGGHAIVTDAYTGRSVVEFLAPGKTFVKRFELEETYGWYNLAVTTDADPSFTQVLAGHVETVGRALATRRSAARGATSRLTALFRCRRGVSVPAKAVGN